MTVSNFTQPALRSLAAFGFLASLLAGLATAETGTLKMRFVYGGDPPAAGPIDVNKDVEFCGKHGLKDETLLIDPATKGIGNVVVYVYTGRGGSEVPKQAPKKTLHVLANENCRFEPHIVIAQTSDTLEITNPDAVGHNANLNFFRNKAVNPTIPAGQSVSVELVEEEPAPIPVDCNIHPWMRAYIVVLEHPFAAASKTDGTLTIEGLPTGEKLVFRAFHEKGKIDDVTVDGKKESWGRSRFEVEIKPGVNDMGDVVLPAAAFN